jgi:serine/threonine-protein kinase
MTEDPSKRIGDYEVLGVLGAGGMGKVFKVRNVISDRIEAMKILLPDLEGRQELADRFLREIKLLASLDHPNIAQLRTALTLSNRLVMVMEYVEGTTLAARLEQGPIPANEALGYVSQVLNALSYAHARNVIHRDIKPGNMMLTPNGTVKLMDFGIARAGTDPTMTVTGTTIGSLFYMSPEQVKGGAVDNRSDLYSLGISLYEMVTGQLPFKTGSDYSLMTAQLQERPKPPSELVPDLPPQLNGIILHSMAKEPADRFQSADEFREAVEAIRQMLPAPAAMMPAAVAPVRPVSVTASPLADPPITAATSVFTGSSTAGLSPTASQVSPVPAPPPSAPVPSVMELSPKPSKGRGLYMALGAAVVLIVLVLAGISLPRMLKTRANEQKQDQKQADQKQNDQKQSADQSSAPQTPNPPPADANSPNANAPSSDAQSGSTPPDSSKPADTSAQPPADSGASATQSSGASAPADANSSAGTTAPSDTTASAGAPSTAKAKSANGKRGKSKGSATASSNADQGSMAASADQSADASAPKAESVQQVEQDVDETSSRATAANDSLDTMRRTLSNQGLNLRGDIASSQELMKTNLDRAQQALQNHDTKNARRYLSMAQAQMEKIEKFLGH